MRKPTVVLTSIVLVLALPGVALAQSGLDQYQEHVPGAGGNSGSGNESGGGGSGGGSTGSSTDGSSGGYYGGSSGGDYSGSGSGSGGYSYGSGGGSSGGGGSGGSGSEAGVTETAGGPVGSAAGPTGSLATGLLMAAAGDLTGDGTIEATPASDADSGGIGIWLPIALGASLLAALGVFAFRRMRSEGPATA